jgi:hypothetical protein
MNIDDYNRISNELINIKCMHNCEPTWIDSVIKWKQTEVLERINENLFHISKYLMTHEHPLIKDVLEKARSN